MDLCINWQAPLLREQLVVHQTSGATRRPRRQGLQPQLRQWLLLLLLLLVWAIQLQGRTSNSTRLALILLRVLLLHRPQCTTPTIPAFRATILEIRRSIPVSAAKLADSVEALNDW